MMDCTASEIFGWRTEANRLIGSEHCIDPADRWHPDEHELSLSESRVLVAKDLSEIDQCLGLLACCWKCGWGTAMEIMYATERRKLVAAVASGRVSPWIRAHSDYLTESVADACRWLSVQLRIDAPCLK